MCLFEERRRDGQFDMPGTNVTVDAARPLRGRKQQLPCDHGLFADDADQLDLVDWLTVQSEH